MLWRGHRALTALNRSPRFLPGSGSAEGIESVAELEDSIEPSEESLGEGLRAEGGVHISQVQETVLEMRQANDKMLQVAEELQRENQAMADRLKELKTGIEDGSLVAKYMQKSNKEVNTGIERIHVTLSSLVSTLEAIKTTERRDSSLIAELRAGVSQLNARLFDILETDGSLEPTVIGAPDLESPVAPDTSRDTPQAQSLAHQVSKQLETLEVQNELLSTLSENIEEVAQSLKSQDPERQESLSALQRLVIRLTSLENSIERVPEVGEQVELLSDQLSEQLGELQADVGLVLKARPLRATGRLRTPYDIDLTNEYYTNLQKIIRVLIKNDKACAYSLEGIQYLYESLHLQASLCELLSAAEFAIRVAPEALEEGIVRPLAKKLGQASRMPLGRHIPAGRLGQDQDLDSRDSLAALNELDEEADELEEEAAAGLPPRLGPAHETTLLEKSESETVYSSARKDSMKRKPAASHPSSDGEPSASSVSTKASGPSENAELDGSSQPREFSTEDGRSPHPERNSGPTQAELEAGFESPWRIEGEDEDLLPVLHSRENDLPDWEEALRDATAALEVDEGEKQFATGDEADALEGAGLYSSRPASSKTDVSIFYGKIVTEEEAAEEEENTPLTQEATRKDEQAPESVEER